MEVGIGAGNQKKEKLSGLATEMETPIAFSQPPLDADKTEPGESALCQSAVLCRAGQPASRPMPCHDKAAMPVCSLHRLVPACFYDNLSLPHHPSEHLSSPFHSIFHLRVN